MRRLVSTMALGLAALACSEAPLVEADRIELMRGFQPETVAQGPEGTYYVATLTGGGVQAVDVATHAVRWVVPPLGIGERVIAGIAYDAARHQIVACGGWLSAAYVFDADSGELLSTVHMPPGLVNAVALRGDDAYFTESVHPVLYHATRDASGRFVGDPIVVPLGGEFRNIEGLMDLDSNGILAPPDRSDVIIAHSTLGVLYRVDPISGDAIELPTGGADLSGADGLVLDPTGLVIVVRNGAAGGVTLLRPTPDFTAASPVGVVMDPRFRSPTSAVRDGDGVWVLSSRLLEIFHGLAAPDDAFELVRVALPEGL